MRIAFYKGKTRLFNRFVSWWTSGPYSHCEAVFSAEDRWDPTQSKYCASASFMDDGVRFKDIVLEPAKWDVIDVRAIDGIEVLEWFDKHRGQPYDVLGLLAVASPIPEDSKKWFCSEAIATAACIRDGWRFDPNRLASVCQRLGGTWIQGGPPTDEFFIKESRYG